MQNKHPILEQLHKSLRFVRRTVTAAEIGSAHIRSSDGSPAKVSMEMKIAIGNRSVKVREERIDLAKSILFTLVDC